MTPDERAAIEELLKDPSLSYRAISRITGVSDWSIRRRARELSNDSRPMRQRSRSAAPWDEEVSAVTGWLVFGGFALVLTFAIWAAVRWTPPLPYRDFPSGFYPDSSTERNDDET